MDNNKIYELTGNELKLFIYLSQQAQMNNDVVVVNSYLKKQAGETLGVGPKTVNNLFFSLVRQKYFSKIDRATYKISNEYAHKGSLKSMEENANKPEESEVKQNG